MVESIKLVANYCTQVTINEAQVRRELWGKKSRSLKKAL